MLRQPAAVALSATAVLFAFSATASAQNFKYPTNCKITASGEINTNAFIGATAFVAFDSDTTSLNASFPITSSSSIYNFFLADSFAELFQTFSDLGCITTAASSVAGQTSHEIVADTSQIRLQINTVSVHSASITRQLPAVGPGGPVTASNQYQIPQLNNLTLTLPFNVSTPTITPATIKVAFDLFRQDSTITTGSMVGAWEIFADANGNCVLDPFEIQLGGAAGIVFPNGTFVAPSTSFAAPAGSYILRTQYFNNIDLFQFSPDCTTSVSAGGFMVDGFNLRIKVG